MMLGLVLLLGLWGLSATLAVASTVNITNQLGNHYAFGALWGQCTPTIDAIPTGYHIERPHAVYNAKSGQWVLWAHYDTYTYTTAAALVATSPNECGPYTIVKTFQPLGHQIRDDFLFEDRDGTAYFIAASNRNGGVNDSMAIFRLTSDYLNVDTSAGVAWAFTNQYREAPVVINNGGVYYLFTSEAAGYLPSQGGYGTSKSMMSGWSRLKPMGDAATYGGQTSGVITIAGSQTTSYILTFDHLAGPTVGDDGNLLLPLVLNNATETATLNWYTNYQVDTATGVLTLPVRENLARHGTATASSSAAANPASNANDNKYNTAWIAASASWPAWWMVDLGAVHYVGEIDISWFMVHGSEAYYQYDIQYSTDGVNFQTIDRTNNQIYGFTSDIANFPARYVKIVLQNAVLWNNPTYNWYTPELWEVKLLPPSNAIETGAPILLVNQNSGQCLDNPGATTTQGIQQDQANCTGATNQLWTLTLQTNGTYEITVGNSGLALDAANGSKTSGSVIDQWPWNGGANQQWILKTIGNGYFRVKNANSGLCMQVIRSSFTSGALVDQATCNGQRNQGWRIQ
jgi:hypothetical protein